MSVDNGTYELLWADNPSYAVDSYGAQDKSYVSVVLHSRNKTDAQFVQVSEPNIWFPLTGMALDVTNAATSVAEGNEVNQFTPNGSKAQLWELVDTGKKKTIGSSQYTVYDLRLTAWTDKVLGTTETPGSGSGPGGTARLTMHTPTYSGFKHGFCLVKTDVLPTGTYEFRAYAAGDDSIRIDVPSDAEDALLRTWPLSDDNRGVWGISTNSDDETQRISNSSNGKVMDVLRAQPVSGQKVMQHEWNSGSNQRWLIIPYGTGKANGLFFPVYKVRSKLGTNLVLDTTDAYAGDISVPVRTEKSSSADQLFHMFPTEAYGNDLPIPSGLGLFVNGSMSSGIQSNGTVKYRMAWLCAGVDYQLRYRIWYRSHDSSTLTASDWLDIVSEACSNDGWGAIWQPNVNSSESPRKTRELSLELSLDGYDRCDIEFEVRRFSKNWGKANVIAHGGSSSGRFPIVWNPTVSLSDLSFAPDGLRIGVSSDLKRDNNDIKLTINGILDTYTFNGMNADVTLEVPMSELKSIPEDGQNVQVIVDYTTSDGANVTVSQQMSVEYNAGHGIAFEPIVTVDKNATVHVSAPEGTRVWLVIHRGHGDRLIEFENIDSVIPPLGVSYRLFASIDKGDTWGTWSKVFEPIFETPGLYRWNWGKNFDNRAAIAWNEGDTGPDFTPTYKADATDHITTGRERVVTTFGNTVSADVNVSGVVVDFYDTPDGDQEAIDALAHCKQAIFRSPRGYWAQVAVKGLSIDVGKKHISSVSVTQNEVTW